MAIIFLDFYQISSQTESFLLDESTFSFHSAMKFPFLHIL